MKRAVAPTEEDFDGVRYPVRVVDPDHRPKTTWSVGEHGVAEGVTDFDELLCECTELADAVRIAELWTADIAGRLGEVGERPAVLDLEASGDA